MRNPTKEMTMFHDVDENLILATDSYKLNHWHQYPEGTQTVYSYLESRPGARWDSTVFFGLQYILERYLTGYRVLAEDVGEATALATQHFGRDGLFNVEGWMHIVTEHDGKLPLCIKAVPEGTIVPCHNVLMTVENTCDKCFWLTNAVESLLTHVWYPATVATLSRATLLTISQGLSETAMSMDGLPFMLHDFGYRGASSQESAAIGGAAHLVNGCGTDTIPAIMLLRDYYDGKFDSGMSVPATEHSVMTALGEEGEHEVIQRLLNQYPNGVLSIVGDSYNIYRFVDLICTDFRDQIMERDGKVVVRPDSPTPQHRTPEDEMVWIADRLYHGFGGKPNAKGYKVLDPHVGILWGDGIDPDGISRIMTALEFHSFSIEACVFGMGGGLLQKVNRDTQRFAFKASAMKRDGEWHDVFKQPLDASKASMKGRLMLLHDENGYRTVPQHHNADDQLKVVFYNGELRNRQTFAEVRARVKETAPLMDVVPVGA